MTTQEAIHQIFERNSNAYFQTVLEANPYSSEEVFIYTDREDPKAALGRVLKKFGDQDWIEVKIEGHVHFYCPEDIAEELKRIKLEMLEHFSQWGCE